MRHISEVQAALASWRETRGMERLKCRPRLLLATKRQVRRRLSGFLHQNNFPPAIIAAVRARPVGKFHFVTVRTLRQSRRFKVVMAATAIAPGF